MARFRWQRSKWLAQQTFHRGLKAFRVILRVAYPNQPTPLMFMSDAISDARCVRLPAPRHPANQNQIQQQPDDNPQIFLKTEEMMCLAR